MAATVHTPIDLNKPAKYPIVLSDALLGRGSKELFTSIRYNHKPDHSSNSIPGQHQLRPSTKADPSKFDLSFTDGPDNYEYHGTRQSGDGQYVLVFDAVKKHFVLHQVDSSFDMNLSSAPWDQDPASLRESYDQIQTSPKAKRKSAQPKTKSQQGARSTAEAKRRKVEKPKKAKTPPREPTPDAGDEDSDDGLTIEYPGGPPPPRFQRNVALPPQRYTKEEVSEESDADAEDEEEDGNERNRDVDVLQLPSPRGVVGNSQSTLTAAVDDDEDLDMDLAAELEQALEKNTGARADESSESEEE